MMHICWDWVSFAGALAIFMLGAVAQSVRMACCDKAEQVGHSAAHAKTAQRENREFGETEPPRGQERESRGLQRQRQKHEEQTFESGEPCVQSQPSQKGRGRPPQEAAADKKWTTYDNSHFPGRKSRQIRFDSSSSESSFPRVTSSSLSSEKTLGNSSVKLKRGFIRSVETREKKTYLQGNGASNQQFSHAQGGGNFSSGSGAGSGGIGGEGTISKDLGRHRSRIWRNDVVNSIDSDVSSASNLQDCERASRATRHKEAKPTPRSSGSRFYADVVSRAQQVNRERSNFRPRSMSFP